MLEQCVPVVNVVLLSLFLLFILPQKAPSGETWEELLHLDGLSLSFTVSPGSGTDGPRHLLLGNISSIRALQDYSWTGALGALCPPQSYQPRHSRTLGTHRKQCVIHGIQLKNLATYDPLNKSHLIMVDFDKRVLWLCSKFLEGRKEGDIIHISATHGQVVYLFTSALCIHQQHIHMYLLNDRFF